MDIKSVLFDFFLRVAGISFCSVFCGDGVKTGFGFGQTQREAAVAKSMAWV